MKFIIFAKSDFVDDEIPITIKAYTAEKATIDAVKFYTGIDEVIGVISYDDYKKPRVGVIKELSKNAFSFRTVSKTYKR